MMLQGAPDRLGEKRGFAASFSTAGVGRHQCQKWACLGRWTGALRRCPEAAVTGFGYGPNAANGAFMVCATRRAEREFIPAPPRTLILTPPHPRGAAIRRCAVGRGGGGACGWSHDPLPGGFGAPPKAAACGGVFHQKGRVPYGGVASRSHLDAGFDRAGQAATAGRLTMGSSLIGAMLSSVM
jgi:hypothetical protein